MASTLLGGIAINEVLVDPNGANNYDTDGNGTAGNTDEFVELVNLSGSDINISGLELWDMGRGNWFTFPSGTILQSGAHAMVMTGVQAGGSLPTGNPGDLFFDAGLGTAVINNGGDNIVVYDPGSDQYIAATFNGDPLDNPPTDYAGFSATATLSGLSEDFGTDMDGFSIQRAPDGSSVFVNNVTPTPGVNNICFTGGTVFDTPDGPRRIERLRPGDSLLTRDHGPQKIRWIGARTHSRTEIARNPALNQIHIPKGALGDNMPAQDLQVSRHHRLLLRSKIARRMFGTDELLVPAKDLLRLAGVAPAPVTGNITYYHILMDRHEILYANGAEAESLYLGQEAWRALGAQERQELQLLLGMDLGNMGLTPPAPARKLAKGRRVQHLVERHMKNRMPLCRTDGLQPAYR